MRGCFVPSDGHVFIDSDFSQIEMLVLGYILKHQLGLGSTLHDLVNTGQDVHRLIAAKVLQKDPQAVTKAERNSVKAISFGLPGGMGVKGLRGYAAATYHQDLSEEEVRERIDAYHHLCPELGPFLQDEEDAGQVLAEVLGLTPHAYRDACNWAYPSANPDDEVPQAWSGGMLLKVLKEPRPATNQGRPYSPEEITYYWEQAQRLPVSLKPALADKLRNRIAGRELWQEIRNWASRRPVLTITGRLWAGASFCSSRNCLFQGPAADGMILGLWELWRCGLKPVSVIHDQVVVEAPACNKVLALKEAIEELMIKGMLEVIPGMNVRMESFVTKSLDKTELDPRYVASEKTPV